MIMSCFLDLQFLGILNYPSIFHQIFFNRADFSILLHTNYVSLLENVHGVLCYIYYYKLSHLTHNLKKLTYLKKRTN